RPGGTAPFEEWETRLQRILCEEEGFDAQNAHELIRRFLHHARHQTGLLAERGLGQLGFFHLTFEEYLAARYIASKRTDDQKKMLKDHWHDPRWQEVILLAAGQLGIIQNSEYINDYLSDIVLIQAENREQLGRPAVLAGRALADIGERVVKRNIARLIKRHLRETMQDIDPDTDRASPTPKIPLLTRADAADIWDELGELPDDLYEFVEINKTANQQTNEPTNPPPFAIAKYPVTNLQYQRFLEADDYADPALWQGFLKFDEKSQPMKGDWGDEGWKNYKEPWPSDRNKDGKLWPHFWRDPRLGVGRRGVPVVGVSWYEANAYCRWVARHWAELEEGQANPTLKPTLLRLPTDTEWSLAAGGEKPEKRYPWDKSGEATQDEKAILARANVSKSGLSRTTPVGMYPLGVSPTEVWDLGGNVWEWQANFRSGTSGSLALRGGSWDREPGYARVSARDVSHLVAPYSSLNFSGFRVLVVLPR
ncbi:MAG TPA: SUMF1/EgtB/PvdO family nonheme iron enzyme, partial [Anaerolineales bacterium]|nr:SUMF1/EgtB/PvdO family nonheme iron enzyme [Anaerolineales bacterium]